MGSWNTSKIDTGNKMTKMATQKINLFITVLSIFCLAPSISAQGCTNGYITFELITGFVYSASEDTLDVAPGTLMLTECLRLCQNNATCQSINFETGLCVLFSSSATQRPGALKTSHFPVFTMYAHKVCLLGTKPCNRDWMFERVEGHILRDLTRKRYSATSRETCIEKCFQERNFQCRSANFDLSTGECAISDMDRHSIPSGSRYFAPSNDRIEYLENNCVDEGVKLCEFQKVNGRIVKTVDAVFENITSLDECRKMCISVPYRCHSFDMSDPASRVCRLSHHDSASLVHIKDPYLEAAGVTTYELSACYNVTILCEAKEMVAKVTSSKLFNGKVYAKKRPNSCVQDVVNRLDFEIKMSYHDLDCDVQQQGFGQFFNDIVIQHHDMIVTNQDLGLSVHCQYDLSNRSIANGIQLEVKGEVDTSGSQSAIVNSPNITMRVTDQSGNDLLSAQVGDPLALRFEIMDKNSPYEIFVRELVAMDGVDIGEILLIDSLGCPTDISIMEALEKVDGNGKILQASFDAFKFPTSQLVQFKALVTPCLSRCTPVRCTTKSFDGEVRDYSSYGRRRRRRNIKKLSPERNSTNQKEVFVVQSIHITDKFGFERSERRLSDFNENLFDNKNNSYSQFMKKESNCVNIMGLFIACSLFLLVQLILCVWACIWQRKNRSKIVDNSRSSAEMLYRNIRTESRGERRVFERPNDVSSYDMVYNISRTSLVPHY
ncbi:uncharacterized protein LOC143223443 isoform X2 [Tachypleus tridentatus]|uniref:uncharacterized protein LOC143223443 isoform X2 n=1 Tax=Tachypleus tridentatus TaxID=6853 RepID=UPI003FD2292D